VIALFDRIDAVRIERDMVLDQCDSFVGVFVRPYRIRGALTAGRNAVVGAFALVRAVSSVVSALQQRHIHVMSRDVLDGRIARFFQRECAVRVGDN